MWMDANGHVTCEETNETIVGGQAASDYRYELWCEEREKVTKQKQDAQYTQFADLKAKEKGDEGLIARRTRTEISKDAELRDGVAFDDATLRIIDRVRADRDADFTSPADQRVRSLNWWKMPGQVELFKKLDVHWRERVGSAIEERRIAEDKRKRRAREEEMEEEVE